MFTSQCTLLWQIIEKRKAAKKQGKDMIEEDMPEEVGVTSNTAIDCDDIHYVVMWWVWFSLQYSKQLKKLITKLFADIEIKKKEMEKAEERDR